MNKLLTTLALTLCLAAPSASADPFGGSLHQIQINSPGLDASGQVSCDDLRRSADLRQRERPSVRRRIIERCEREKQRGRLARIAPPTTPEP